MRRIVRNARSPIEYPPVATAIRDKPISPKLFGSAHPSVGRLRVPWLAFVSASWNLAPQQRGQRSEARRFTDRPQTSNCATICPRWVSCASAMRNSASRRQPEPSCNALCSTIRRALHRIITKMGIALSRGDSLVSEQRSYDKE
jgi:hypothetical protein